MRKIFILRNRLTGGIWCETAFADEAAADGKAQTLNASADPYTTQYVVNFLWLVEDGE